MKSNEDAASSGEQTRNNDDVEYTCCQEPNVGPCPVRRFKLPGRKTRETKPFCANCGTWEPEEVSVDEFDPEKFEDIGCPECGGNWYYEPKLRYGTRYEATSGWACQECSWTKVDPSSGKPASAPTPTPEDVEAYADRYLGAIPPCPDCGGSEVELGRVAVTDDNGEYVTNADGSVEVEPVIECADCRLTLRENPSPDIVGYLGSR